MTRNELLQELVILAALLVIFFYKSLFFGEILSPAGMLFESHPWVAQPHDKFTTQPLRSDDVYLEYPLYKSHFEQLKKGIFPQWNPYVLSGKPAFWSNTYLGLAFNPLHILFYLLPTEYALAPYAMLRLLLAGLFMYLFLREIGVRHAAGVLGSVVFMLNGQFVVWLGSYIPTAWLWMPLGLFFIERAIRHGSMTDILGLALVFTFQFFSSYYPTSVIFCLIAGLYALVRGLQEFVIKERSNIKLLGFLSKVSLAVAVSLLLLAVYLIPSMYSLLESKLVTRPSTLFQYPYENFITYLIPNFFGDGKNSWFGYGNYCENVAYVGVLPLFLAFVAYILNWENNRVRIFTFLAAFTLSYQYGLPLIEYLGYLPGLKQVAITRWSSVVSLSVAVLASLGADRLASFRREDRKKLLPVILALATVFILYIAYLWFIYIGHMARRKIVWTELGRLGFFLFITLSLVLTVILCLRSRRWQRRCPYIVFLITSVDLMVWGVGFNPTLKHKDFYPVTEAIAFLQSDHDLFRIAPIGDFPSLLPGDVAEVYHLQSIAGYDLLNDDAYRTFLASMSDADLKPRIVNNYIQFTSGRASTDLHVLNFPVDLNSQALDLLNVKYLIFPPGERLDPDKLKKKYTLVYDKEVKILRNLSALPRAWVVYDYIVSNDRSKILKMISKGELDARQIVVLERQPSLHLDALEAKETSSVVDCQSEHPNKRSVRVRLNRPGFLVLSERYHPFWTAYLDGQKAELYKANYLFGAVALPAGEHTVDLVYKNHFFWTGAAISLVTIVSLLLFVSQRLRGPSRNVSDRPASPLPIAAHESEREKL